MNGFLHGGIVVLHADGRAVKPDLAQRRQMVARQMPRINFDSSFGVSRDGELRVKHFSERANFIRSQERGRAAAKMKLHDLAFWIEQRRHQRQLLFQVSQIPRTLALLCRDDRRAAAIPAKRLAKRHVEIERKIAFRLIVGEDLAQ